MFAFTWEPGWVQQNWRPLAEDLGRSGRQSFQSAESRISELLFELFQFKRLHSTATDSHFGQLKIVESSVCHISIVSL